MANLMVAEKMKLMSTAVRVPTCHCEITPHIKWQPNAARIGVLMLLQAEFTARLHFFSKYHHHDSGFLLILTFILETSQLVHCRAV